MSEQEPGPSENPYGQPTNPYGQQPSTPNPYGQAYGEPQSPQPQPYGQQPQPYGTPYSPSGGGDSRPGTVTAAGWITIVLSGLSAALFGIVGLLFLVARDSIVAELERVPEFEQADLDPDSVVGVMVAFMLVLVIWAVISLVLGIFVLRRSNVARILLVMSAAVVAVGSLLSITSGLSVVWLIGAIAVIAMLFVGGAGDWFGRRSGPGAGGYQGYGSGYGEQQPGSPYGDAPGGYGGQGQNQPYGTPPPGGNPPQQGQGPSGTDYPPTDYPGR